MAALAPGTHAPDFILHSMDDKVVFPAGSPGAGTSYGGVFQNLLPHLPVRISFSAADLRGARKQGCHHRRAFLRTGKKDTAAFLKQYGITFPVLLDDTASYPVSNAYGLTNVPTIFWIAQDGEIEISSVGWIRKEMEELNLRAAQASSEASSRCSAQMSRSLISAPVEGRKTSPRSRAHESLSS